MPRVKRGNVRRAKRKKLLARAKGFYQTKSKLYRSAKESVDTALKYAFVGRRRRQAGRTGLTMVHEVQEVHVAQDVRLSRVGRRGLLSR